MSFGETTWPLPFGPRAELDLRTEFGSLSLEPVEAGRQPRLELTRGSAEHVEVRITTHGDVVRVELGPRSFPWFGGWECRASVYVPRDVRARVETNAGSVHVRGLDGCDLSLKANAGKIDLRQVRGRLQLAADAGSITGREIAGHFDIETQAGSVRLDVLGLEPGEHRVRAAVGSIRLELARGLDVRLDLRNNLGSVHSRYPSNPNAPTVLVLSSEMGAIRVDEGAYAAVSPSPPPPTSSPPPPPRSEDAELERILKMVESGELSAQDADELLRAMGLVEVPPRRV